MSSPSNTPLSRSEKLFSWLINLPTGQVDRLFRTLFILSTVAGIAIVRISPLDLSADEAHYWEWSRHLDLSYYSKGPGIAYLIRLGTTLAGTNDFGVRLGAILCYSLLSAFLYFILRALYGAHAAFLTWLLFRSSLAFSFTNYVITTDPPTLLLWFLAICCAALAIKKDRPSYWVGAWVSIGLVMLFKYTAALLGLSFIGFVLFSKQYRKLFVNPFFLLGMVAAAVCLLPIVLWNAEHDWVNFAHNAGHVVSQTAFSLRPQFVLELIGGQLGLVGPLMLPLLFVVLVRRCRSAVTAVTNFPEIQFLIWTVIPLLVLCVVTAFTKRVYANWPLPAYLGLLFLFAAEYPMLVSASKKMKDVIVGGIAINCVILFIANLLMLGFTFGVSPKILPTKKLAGWQSLGSSVEEFLNGRPDGDSLFVLTSRYDDASAIAFYDSKHPQVFCADNGERRMNQYDIWGGWEKLKGRSAFIVLREKEVPASISKHFAAISPLADWLAVFYGGESLREYNFFIGINYDGYVPPVPEKF